MNLQMVIWLSLEIVLIHRYQIDWIVTLVVFPVFAIKATKLSLYRDWPWSDRVEQVCDAVNAIRDHEANKEIYCRAELSIAIELSAQWNYSVASWVNARSLTREAWRHGEVLESRLEHGEQ